MSTKRGFRFGAVLVLGLLFAAGCVTVVDDVPQPLPPRPPGPPPPPAYRPEPQVRRGNPPIPPGHLPDPGRCRIWLPGTPAGQQPVPGACRSLERRVPPGGWLVYRPADNPNIVEISYFHPTRVGVVERIVAYKMPGNSGKKDKHHHDGDDDDDDGVDDDDDGPGRGDVVPRR